jgi:hypothetical protein
MRDNCAEQTDFAHLRLPAQIWGESIDSNQQRRAKRTHFAYPRLTADNDVVILPMDPINAMRALSKVRRTNPFGAQACACHEVTAYRQRRRGSAAQSAGMNSAPDAGAEQTHFARGTRIISVRSSSDPFWSKTSVGAAFAGPCVLRPDLYSGRLSNPKPFPAVVTERLAWQGERRIA